MEAVCEFLQIKPRKLVKTLVYLADGEAVAVLVRGDREVQEVKLKNLLGVSEVELADDKQVYDATGVPSGYLGPVGIPIRMVADQEVAVMRNVVVGANEKNFHLQNVNYGRDFKAESVADLRQITMEDACPSCGGSLGQAEGIEVGHIFKLGTVYSEAMNALYQDSDGQEKTMVMGCYGIGVSRIVAAAIEQNHDQHGIIFPVPLAPYQAVVLNLDPKEKAISTAADLIYDQLRGGGLDVLLDDRDERPGFKFKDADLLGFPYRVTVGRRLAKDGLVELRHRRDGLTEELTPEQAVSRVRELVAQGLGHDR